MPPAGYPYERNFIWAQLLELFAVLNGDQHVFRAVDNIGMAIHFPDPFIGAQVVAQYIPDGKKRQESFHHFPEIVIRCIKYKVARTVVGSNFGSKATTYASPVYNNMRLKVFVGQRPVYELQVGHDVLFASFACAFSNPR